MNTDPTYRLQYVYNGGNHFTPTLQRRIRHRWWFTRYWKSVWWAKEDFHHSKLIRLTPEQMQKHFLDLVQEYEARQATHGLQP